MSPACSPTLCCRCHPGPRPRPHPIAEPVLRRPHRL
jgi:hypothetical protein